MFLKEGCAHQGCIYMIKIQYFETLVLLKITFFFFFYILKIKRIPVMAKLNF